ncbi:hypothetical protein GGU10DRAFT_336328 [Lentinula aff. detonsa]|uniref:Uncharacterized protein n=1 Tax=Lentinula aff. detonsa TaxID=2804958 RepID=A0AA38KCB7_9AGAR|nr:hypothetical protein GGU10DRAFT_336328 [Lentinula aff. detonsa]
MIFSDLLYLSMIPNSVPATLTSRPFPRLCALSAVMFIPADSNCNIRAIDCSNVTLEMGDLGAERNGKSEGTAKLVIRVNCGIKLWRVSPPPGIEQFTQYSGLLPSTKYNGELLPKHREEFKNSLDKSSKDSCGSSQLQTWKQVAAQKDALKVWRIWTAKGYAVQVVIEMDVGMGQGKILNTCGCAEPVEVNSREKVHAQSGEVLNSVKFQKDSDFMILRQGLALDFPRAVFIILVPEYIGNTRDDTLCPLLLMALLWLSSTFSLEGGIQFRCIEQVSKQRQFKHLWFLKNSTVVHDKHVKISPNQVLASDRASEVTATSSWMHYAYIPEVKQSANTKELSLTWARGP